MYSSMSSLAAEWVRAVDSWLKERCLSRFESRKDHQCYSDISFRTEETAAWKLPPRRVRIRKQTDMATGRIKSIGGRTVRSADSEAFRLGIRGSRPDGFNNATAISVSIRRRTRLGICYQGEFESIRKLIWRQGKGYRKGKDYKN